MNAYEVIRNELQKVAGDGFTFTLSPNEDLAHGDYATNIAFSLSKRENNSPKECAENLLPTLQESLTTIVEKIEVAGPGFINFFLKDSVVREENEKEETKLTTKYTGKNILVEHSSPNLFKPFSVGHLMNNVIGEFVARATKVGGGNVKTMSFPSDVSLGIAKALVVVLEEKKDIFYFEQSTDTEIISYLGDAYVRGVKECEENENSLKKAVEILRNLYFYSDGKGDEYFRTLVSSIRIVSERYFKQVLESIDSSIDSFVYESQVGGIGKGVVESNTGDDKVFKRSEGAIVYFPNEDRKDINTSVFVNGQGYPTYEAKDLGLIQKKFIEYGDIHASYFITDAEQVSHFKVVLDAASKLGGDWPEWVAKSIHVPHGRMLFKGAKMSSRLGGVPLALDVIGVVEEEVKERAGEKIEHLSDDEKQKLTREIALSALRIAVLRSKPGININFDPETSLSFEGDSGPYLLYTHARCSSLLEKGSKKGYTAKFGNVPVTNLERELATFSLVLKDAIETLSPQKLVTYLFKVSQGFNSFYGNTQIISDDKEMSEHNLAIVKRVKYVLKGGLHVLGIEAPERM